MPKVLSLKVPAIAFVLEQRQPQESEGLTCDPTRTRIKTNLIIVLHSPAVSICCSLACSRFKRNLWQHNMCGWLTINWSGSGYTVPLYLIRSADDLTYVSQMFEMKVYCKITVAKSTGFSCVIICDIWSFVTFVTFVTLWFMDTC